MVKPATSNIATAIESTIEEKRLLIGKSKCERQAIKKYYRWSRVEKVALKNIAY